MRPKTTYLVKKTGIALLALGGFLLAVTLVHLSDSVSFGAALDGFLGKWGYPLITLCAGGSIICGGLASPDRRGGWLVIGLSIVVWVAGTLYYTAFLWDLAVLPVPSFSDVCWVASIPVCFVGLVWIFHRELRHKKHGLWIDGVAAALTVTAFVTAFVLDPLSGSMEFNAQSFWTLAVPIGDTALLAFLVGAGASVGWAAPRGVALVALGFAGLVVMDFIYSLMLTAGTWVPGVALEAGWPAAFLIVALGVRQFRPHTAIQLHQRNAVTVVAAPVIFALANLGLLVYSHFRPLSTPALLFAILSTLAVIARMGKTFVQNVSILRTTEEHSLTDALTGLGNRRALTADLDRVVRDGTPAFLVLCDLDGFKGFNDSFGHPAGDALLQRMADRLGDCVGNGAKAYRMGGDEFCVLALRETHEVDTEIATYRASLAESGPGYTVTASCGYVLIPDQAASASAALREADVRLYADKNSKRASAGRQVCDTLRALVAERDAGLEQHIGEVANLAVAVAERLGLRPADVEEIRLAAELHDVGKAAIPDRILGKEGPLTPEEWEVIKQHTIIGERILSAAPALRNVAKLVRSSHERADGKGYPDGLAADEIPLGAQIVAVSDAFDAMVSDRPYRDKMTDEEAVHELRRCSGTQFTPAVVEAAVQVILDSALEDLLSSPDATARR